MKFQFAYKVQQARHDLLILVHTQSTMRKHAIARFVIDICIYFIISVPLGKAPFNGLKKYSIFIRRLYMRYV